MNEQAPVTELEVRKTKLRKQINVHRMELKRLQEEFYSAMRIRAGKSALARNSTPLAPQPQ
jgi:hypothetical protein